MKKPALLVAVLAGLAIWALASQLPLSVWFLQKQLHSSKLAQVPFVLHQFGDTIGEVRPEYAGSGLRVGDEVVAINGIAIDGEEQLAQILQAAKPNDLLTVRLDRNVDGRLVRLAASVRLQSHVQQLSEWPVTIIVRVVLPIYCLFVGFYVALARPTDPLAWLTMAMLASFSQFAASSTPLLLDSPWRELVFVYHPLLANTWPLWMLLFGFYFPEPFPSIQRRPWIAWLLALPFMVFVAADIYGNFRAFHHLHSLVWLAAFERRIDATQIVFFTLFVFAFFGSLTVKARKLKTADPRRRLRLMISGCSLALTPSLLVVGADFHLVPALPEWLVAVCLSMLILFPVTMAYVIVVQRSMDVRMVIRSGVQYAFATAGIRVLQIAIAVVVVTQTIRLTQISNRLVEEVTIGTIGGVLVMSLRRVAGSARAWMDRRFFREAYNAEVILTNLSSSVAGIRDVKVLVETVSKRISESLHVPRIAVFLEREGVFRPAYALGLEQPPQTVVFQPLTGVVSYLKRQQAPSKVYFGDPQNWVHGAPELEQEILRTLDTQVLLPISLKSRLLGMISLGSKRSEEPYSRADLQLLGAVSSQTGLALENAELTESVKREIAQRERVNRELEIAREVQQRLFPQKLPLVTGLDFAGYCRPAEGVGGDYYDFIRLPDMCLGIAVGDVSGKGIAAALMMASLQASLRGQTIKPCETLSEMIQHINRLVYDASAENRYATFFYAQYYSATRGMRYVNAGHNPPMVCRQVNGRHEFIRLEDGGTVVGLFPESPFTEGFIQLEAGDVVVAFTDGISEAMNEADEEYGEERMMAALGAMQARSAADMITHVLDQVDGFTGDAKQHDDMTLVVMRVQ